MRWIRLLFRIFGWLLTPFLAWAASFFGAVGGALVAMRMEDPVQGLAVTALCGALTGFAGLIGWLAYLRRSPEVREVLAGREPARTIAMCGSGVTACHLILAMEHAGLPGAKLFTGSWSGWIEDPSRPVATGS